MDEKLQKIILEKLKEAGGKCEMERLYQNRVIVEYLNEDGDISNQLEVYKYRQRKEKIDHNLSLLQERGMVKMYASSPAVLNATNTICELTPVGYESLNMEKDMKDLSDKELQDIVRKAENTNVPASRYNRAQIELDIRHKSRMENNNKPDSFISKFFWYFVVAVAVAVIAPLITHYLFGF